MNKSLVSIVMLMFFMGSLLYLTSCGDGGPLSANEEDEFTETFPSDIPLVTEGLTSLTPEEQSGLLWMREEEKLARDLYMNFFDMYQKPIFRKIAASEQKHMNTLERLLAVYQIPDPVGTNPRGVFTDPQLQTLYNGLSATGAVSLDSALITGGAVEELDLLDLQNQLQNVAVQVNLNRVYTKLLFGSANHLRAFVRNLSRLGITYVPQYLTVEEFNRIINR